MGNSLGRKNTTKVMKINGETFKLKTPVTAGEVVKDYPPGHVVLESEAVKHYGHRAKPLEPHQNLVSKRLYFLVELPKAPVAPRKVRSGINMGAQDRLESLMLARRSVSDLAIMKPTSVNGHGAEEELKNSGLESAGAKRVKMRLPKAEVDKLMQESKDETEVAAKIMDLCNANRGNSNGNGNGNGNDNGLRGIAEHGQEGHVHLQQQVQWRSGHGSVQQGLNTRQKRVSFQPVSEGEMQIAVATS